jgi:hypothetical protein
LTDPELVNFTAFDFTLNDIPNSMIEEGGSTLTQHAREISMVISAELVLDSTVTRQIMDSVKVRNDFLELTGP